MEKLKKQQLVDLAKELGYFDKKETEKMYARSSGNFYYTKPPKFVDEHETFIITKEDLGGKSGNAFPLNAPDTIEKINVAESEQELLGFITSDEYSENETRSTVLKALEAKQEELKTD